MGLTEHCAHCGVEGTLVETACYDCAVVCAKPGCDAPADPAAIGGLCPMHQPADNTLPVEEPPLRPSNDVVIEDTP